MFQCKKLQAGSNIVNPLYTQCEASQTVITGMHLTVSFVHYHFRHNCYGQTQSLSQNNVSYICNQSSHKSCAVVTELFREDHILHLEIHGDFSRIIGAELGLYLTQRWISENLTILKWHQSCEQHFCDWLTQLAVAMSFFQVCFLQLSYAGFADPFSIADPSEMLWKDQRKGNKIKLVVIALYD